MRDRSYFRSEDPVEAARFVVSDAAAMLWESVLDRQGFKIAAERAAEQLVRWESRYGWTRGWGQVHEKETSLASVLARMLRVPDLWTVFADRYLDALDQVARAEAAKPKSRRAWGFPDADYVRRHRTGDLAEWHELLLDRLVGSRAEDRLDRLFGHPALAGPELTFLRARLAGQRGDLDGARKLLRDCLQELPGHQGFASFAAEIGAQLPPDARKLVGQRSQWEAACEIEFGRFAVPRRKARGEGKPETFSFLGFTHICAVSRRGRFWVRRVIESLCGLRESVEQRA